ncbi:MAG: LysR family transcriptional regulator [Oxalobacteraceae bacterium]|jgi:DNA-binding transcriptional LysR family regulator|nr:LysR family transcriptional regulator [Oxalobacteraceae bacterium]
MDRLQAMQLFVRVAELNSFSAVAQQMGVARSVVTRQIAGLEQHLGLKLMARSTRRLTLTSAGAAYLEKCRVILNLVEAAETGIAEESQRLRGHLRISLPLSFGLTRIVPPLLEFARTYPEVSLEMDYSDRRVNLFEEGMDLAIRITGQLGDSAVVRKLGSLQGRTVASTDYLKRFGCPQHPSELMHHACLVYTTSGSPQIWRYLVDGVVQSFSVRSRIQANNGQALTEAAAQGLGIALQPDFIVEPFLQEQRVMTILTDFETPELGIYAMLPGNRQVPHRVRVLMDFLADRLGPNQT